MDIMAKCNSCGKRRIFLKVNKFGRCSACEQLFKASEEQKLIKELKDQRDLEAAEVYFQEIVKLYNEICFEFSLEEATLEELFALLDTKILICNNLRKLLSSHEQYPMLYKVLFKHTVYYSDSQYGNIPEINLFVCSDSKKSVVSDLLRYPDRLIEDINRMKRRFRKKFEFQNIIDEMEAVPIVPVPSKKMRFKVSDLLEIKYTSVTSRSNYERLGTFTAIDVETTGLNCQKSKLIEVSAVYFEHWKPIKYFSTLINPDSPIPEEITELTGINDETVKEAPTFSSIASSLMDFIGNTNIVGHNLEFDLKFLYRNGINFLSHKRKYYDTLKIVKTVLKRGVSHDSDVSDYKLTTLCDYYDIRDNDSAHRSLSDALSTGLLFKNLADEKMNS